MSPVDPHAGTILVLQKTQPWVRLAGVVGFLLSGVMAFLGINGMVGGLASRRFETIPLLLVEFVFAVVFLAQALYLTKYANRIGLFVAQGHIVQLEAAMEAQRKFWKLSGLCVLLSLVALTLVAGFALLLVPLIDDVHAPLAGAVYDRLVVMSRDGNERAERQGSPRCTTGASHRGHARLDGGSAVRRARNGHRVGS